MLSRSWRTTPRPRVRRSGLFSAKTKRGRTSPMIRAYSFQRPLRSPVIPAPLPAAEMSWQGNPPLMTSTFPRQGLPSKVQTLSQIGNRSRCPSRCRSSTRSRGYFSSSQAHTVFHPRSRLASSPPPAPLKSANSFIYAFRREEKSPLSPFGSRRPIEITLRPRLQRCRPGHRWGSTDRRSSSPACRAILGRAPHACRR